MDKQRGNPSHQEEEEEEEEEDSEDSDNPEAEIWHYKREPVAQSSKAWGQPLALGESSSIDKESQEDTEATWNHSLQISPNTSHKMEAVFSMVKKIYGRQPGGPMKDLNVNLALWRMFMNTTLRASVHRGKDYDMDLRFVKNYLWKTTRHLLQRNRKVDQWSDRNHRHKGQAEPQGNKWGSCRVTRHVGHMDSARPAPEPPWDRVRACAHQQAWQRSISELAIHAGTGSCCHPRWLPSSKSSSSWCAPTRRIDVVNSSHGGANPITPVVDEENLAQVLPQSLVTERTLPCCPVWQTATGSWHDTRRHATQEQQPPCTLHVLHVSWEHPVSEHTDSPPAQDVTRSRSHQDARRDVPLPANDVAQHPEPLLPQGKQRGHHSLFASIPLGTLHTSLAASSHRYCERHSTAESLQHDPSGDEVVVADATVNWCDGCKKSVKLCRACATHSHPALVATACWCGLVWAGRLFHSCKIVPQLFAPPTSSLHPLPRCPRTPPWSFDNAVILPSPTKSTTACGTWASANLLWHPEEQMQRSHMVQQRAQMFRRHARWSSRGTSFWRNADCGWICAHPLEQTLWLMRETGRGGVLERLSEHPSRLVAMHKLSTFERLPHIHLWPLTVAHGSDDLRQPRHCVAGCTNSGIWFDTGLACCPLPWHISRHLRSVLADDSSGTDAAKSAGMARLLRTMKVRLTENQKEHSQSWIAPGLDPKWLRYRGQLPVPPVRLCQCHERFHTQEDVSVWARDLQRFSWPCQWRCCIWRSPILLPIHGPEQVPTRVQNGQQCHCWHPFAARDFAKGPQHHGCFIDKTSQSGMPWQVIASSSRSPPAGVRVCSLCSSSSSSS